MKLKEGFVLRKVADTYVVVAVGEESRDFNGIIRLNDTGRFLWEKLQGDISEDGLVSAMLLEYDIDEATAGADIDRFIEKVSAQCLLEE